ncbi:MAG: hypothetical protein K2I64_06655 [Muribaculaceae bacterium]|nr:hypothetical protein [Muribaculaceae bacterium]
MTTKTQSVSHANYTDRVLEVLTKDMNWECGTYVRNGKEYLKKHILPLKNNDNTLRNRADAIKKYFEFDCKPYLPGLRGLHQYAHHVNSSQILCMMFFSKLIDVKHCATKEMVKFMKDAFNIEIHEGAKCDFEYKEDIKFDVLGKSENEGTSFDFHIKDDKVEVYFEIKFTEDGFAKEKKDADERHKCKARQYEKLLPEYLKDNATAEDILLNYQIFRNIIRADNDKKYVIFITDGNNPATNEDIKAFLEKFGTYIDSNHIQFKTWQEIKDKYPFKLPMQFEAL